MLDELKRVALITSGVAELTRNRAEQIVRDLVASGDVRRDKYSSTVRELVAFARENRREVLQMMSGEVRSQIENLGVVTKRDIERLERRIKRLEDRGTGSGSSGGGTTTRSAAKKTTRKASAKKSTAKKSTAKKTSAKKSTRKKSTAKRSTARSAASKANTPRTRGATSDGSGGGSAGS